MDRANRILARLSRIPDDLRRLLHRRRTAAAWIGGILLLCLWIGWTIYVGIANGWTAALGVLITWPLLACIVALIVISVVGVRRLVQGQRGPAIPAMAGGGPPPKLPKGHDSVTTITFPS